MDEMDETTQIDETILSVEMGEMTETSQQDREVKSRRRGQAMKKEVRKELEILFDRLMKKESLTQTEAYQRIAKKAESFAIKHKYRGPEDKREISVNTIRGMMDGQRKELWMNEVVCLALGYRYSWRCYEDASVYNLPPANPIFFRRESESEKLDKALQSHRQVTLVGPPGVGKTQIALEIIDQIYDQYPYIFWINAGLEQPIELMEGSQTFLDAMKAAVEYQIKREYQKLAIHLKCASPDTDLQTAVQNVKDWLENRSQWLLIFDNADYADVNSFVPHTLEGRILVTARDTAIKGEDIVIEPLAPDVGAQFLLHCAKIKRPSADDLKKAALISEMVGGLPLSLDEAATYLRENRTQTPGDYLRRYLTCRTKHSAELLDRRGSSPNAPHLSAYITYRIARDDLVRRNPAAAELLDICAFLSPDRIPEECFTEGPAALDGALGSAAQTEYGLTDALGLLYRYSLLRRDSDARAASIHRSEQDVLRAIMDPERRRICLERTVRAFHRAYSSFDLDDWELSRRFENHAHAVARWILNEKSVSPEALRLLNRTAEHSLLAARFQDAVSYCQAARTACHEKWGETHRETLRSDRILGHLYDHRGEYAQSEELLTHVLHLQYADPRTDPSHLAQTLNYLSNLRIRQGRFEEAISCCERALALIEREKGPDHSEIGLYCHNMAESFRNEDRYEEALPYAIRTREIYDRHYPPISLNRAHALHGLAQVYYALKRDAEAEPLFLETLDIRKQLLGDQHVSTATCVNNLALLRILQQDYAEAEKLMKEVQKVYRAFFDVDHPYLAYCHQNLGYIYMKLQRYEDAVAEMQRALDIRVKKQGSNYSALGVTHYHLAGLKHRWGWDREAEEHFKRSYTIFEVNFGPKNPSFQIALRGYADFLREVGRIGEADQIENRLAGLQAAEQASPPTPA